METEGTDTTVFSSAERKELSAQNPITSKISFRNEGEIKMFLDEEKLKEFVVSRPNVKE